MTNTTPTTTPTSIREWKKMPKFQKKSTATFKLKSWPNLEEKHKPYSRVKSSSNSKLMGKNYEGKKKPLDPRLSQIEEVSENAGTPKISKSEREIQELYECKKKLVFDSPGKPKIDENKPMDVDTLQNLLKETEIKSDK